MANQVWPIKYTDPETGFDVKADWVEPIGPDYPFALQYGSLSDSPEPHKEGWIALFDARFYEPRSLRHYFENAEGKQRELWEGLPPGQARGMDWEQKSEWLPEINLPITKSLRSTMRNDCSWYYKPDAYGPQQMLREYRELKSFVGAKAARATVTDRMRRQLENVVDYVRERWVYLAPMVEVSYGGVKIAVKTYSPVQVVGGCEGQFDNADQIEIIQKDAIRNTIRQAKQDVSASLDDTVKGLINEAIRLMELRSKLNGVG